MKILDKIIAYSEDVLSEKEVACVKHKWSCQRFLRDIDRLGKRDFPYFFSEEKAQDFLDWMTYFKHTKGPLAGQYKIPEPIEEFIFGQLYGWLESETEYRRFRKFYWQVGKKNAKSQDLAILGLYETAALGEPCSEVYVAATQKAQTRYVWGEADIIAGQCEWLEGKIITKYHEPVLQKVILHPKSQSFFARMSKEERKKGDGANPQCGLLDEYHLHETEEYYNNFTSGMKSRKQPLLGIITTAGTNLNYPCYKIEYRYVSEILDPNCDIENDRYLVMINELDKDEEGNLIDNIEDEKCWPKANPIVCKTREGIVSIRDELQLANGKPEKMTDFLTKTMDVWCEDRAKGYMNRAKWKACGASKGRPFPKLAGLKCRIGVDLTSKLDLASVVFHFELPNGIIAIKHHSFMPESAYIRRMSEHRQPWDLWKKQKWITVTPEEVFDDRFMEEYIFRMMEKNQWEWGGLGFDLYNATQFINRIRTDRGRNKDDDCIEVRQGIPSLHEPTKDFREKVYAKQVIHENDPVLNFAFGNAMLDVNAQGNMMIHKGLSYDNVDPAAACMNAHYLSIKQKPPENHVPYNENRGIILL